MGGAALLHPGPPRAGRHAVCRGLMGRR